MVVAWSADFTGSVIDYGSWPDQKTDYYTARDARRTLSREFPGKGLEARIYAGVAALTQKLRERVFVRDDGAEMRIGQCAIDANWGKSTDTVYLFCRQSDWSGIVLPSHGKYVGAASKPWEQYTRRPGELLGNHWMLPSVKGKRAVRHLLIDTNYWKSFIHCATGRGDGRCRLPGELRQQGRRAPHARRAFDRRILRSDARQRARSR